MKKLYTLALASLMTTAVSAQKSAVLPGKPVHLNRHIETATNRTPTDTLYGWLLTGASPTIIGSINGGYVCGNNGYADKEKAQGFLLGMLPSGGAAVAVEEVIIWWGAAEIGSTDTNSFFKVNVYNMNGAGINNSSSGNFAPNSSQVIGTVNGRIKDIDTTVAGENGFSLYQFPAPVYCGMDFAVGVDFTTLTAGDTCGFVSSSDGDAGQADLSWERWSDNSWHSMLQAWPLDIDFAVFPIIDNAPASVQETTINGMLLSEIMPNPATEQATVSYELTQAFSNITIKVMNAHGKKVFEFREGAKGPGKYTFNFETASLSPGLYFYTIENGKSGFGRKFQVTK